MILSRFKCKFTTDADKTNAQKDNEPPRCGCDFRSKRSKVNVAGLRKNGHTAGEGMSSPRCPPAWSYLSTLREVNYVM